MHITVARLYHPAPWGWLYSYQAALITLRMLELSFVTARYLFFRAPLLVIWTRFPGLRSMRPPYKGLGGVLAPTKERASLSLGAGQLGTDLAEAQTVDDISGLMAGFLRTVKPPSRFWSVFGCVMRGFITDLGPAFIKFGQIMSMREEVPPTVRRELQLIQDRLPPMNPDEVKKRLEKELGKPVDVVFEWVEYTPIAAGSLAQVHRAKLRREQEEVALKVRRPYLEGIVTLDTIIICDIFFGILNLCLPLLHKSTDTKLFTSSYRESLEQEIDLVLEARNQERYRKQVMNHPIYWQTNYIAKVYPEYTTTKLIVMELVKNYYRLDRLIDELTPNQLLQFATTKVDGYPTDLPLQLPFSQIALCIEGMVSTGFFHGDFHLGNLYALAPDDEAARWRIFICDFGMMQDFARDERLGGAHSFLSLSYYCDGRIMAECFMGLCSEPLSKRQRAKVVNHIGNVWKKYLSEPEEGAEKVVRVTIRPGSPTNIIGEMVYGAATLGLKMEGSDVWLLLKNYSYVSSMGLTLSTNLNLNPLVAGHSKKFLKDWTMAELNALDIADLRTYLPEKLRFLRHDDRNQVFKALATGEEIVPKAQIWTAPGRDIRFGMK